MSRKETSIALILVLLTLALSACARTPAAEPVGEPEVETESAFPVTVVDGLGTEVTIEAAPQRIVSMTLGTDELLLDLVGPERLAAVTYLAADATTSNIAGRPELAEIEAVVEPNPSPEQIIALEPDLVFVASFTEATVIEQLRGAGLPVFAVSFFSSIEAMQDNILTIGEVVGEAAGAEAIVAQMDAQLAQIEQALEPAGDALPGVLYLSTGGWVAGSESTVDDIIRRAGGANVAGDLVDWQQISEEALIELNPDVVVLSPYVLDEEFVGNPAFQTMAALENGQVFAISDAYMSATSQYIVRGVEVLAHHLHPDLVPAPDYLPEGAAQ
jgi:iron complex transport system substrate-binding protein